MSFSGPTAPISRRARSRDQKHGLQRARISADLLRLLLAFLAAVAITAAGCLGLTVSTAPAWVSLVVQPCSLLLLPGYFVESLDQNGYAFSRHSVLAITCAIYFCLALLLLFPRPLRKDGE